MSDSGEGAAHEKGLRRRWWYRCRGELAMVALAACLVVVAYPAVFFQGKSFSSAWQTAGVRGIANPPPPNLEVPNDRVRLDRGASAWQFEPWVEVTNRELESGRLPLWNPYQGVGAPLAANLQSAAFDPLLAPVNLHPTPLIWDICFVLAFLLGAMAMYLFLRQIGLDGLPALTGTAPFILCGFFFLYSNNHFFRSYMYLPVLLLFAQRTVRSRGLLAPLGLACAITGNLLVGMPEASIFVLGFLGLYCLWLLCWPPCPIHRGTALLKFAGAAAGGAALAAPLLLPALEYIRLSVNTHGPGSNSGLIYAAPRELVTWLVPYVFGSVAQDLRGAHSGTRNWLGLAATVAVLAAIASPRPMRRYGGWFFCVLGIIVLAKGYGFALVQWAGHLPVLDRTIIPVYAMPLVTFCAAVLVGIAVQSVSSGELRAAWFAGLVGLLSVAAYTLLRANRPFLAGIPANHLFRWFALAGLAGVVAAAGALIPKRWARFVLAVAVIGELIALVPHGYMAERADPFIRPTWVRYLAQHIASTHDRVIATDGTLFPNTAGAYGILDLRALDGLYPKRYTNFIRTFIQPDFHDRFIGGAIAIGEQRPNEIGGGPMFDLTGVRYVLTDGRDMAAQVIDAYFDANPPTDLIRRATVDLGGDRRPALSVQASAKATIAVPSGATKLALAVALDPSPGPPGRNLRTDGLITAVGSSPTAATASRRVTVVAGGPWQEVTIDLPQGTHGVDLGVPGVADPKTRVAFADLRFGFGTGEPPGGYREVLSSDGVRVFENLGRLPRAFVADRPVPVRDESGAMAFFRSVSETLSNGGLRVRDFDPRRQAVVEELPPESAARIEGCDQPGQAKIRSYESDSVVIDVDTSCPGLLVLTDLYFPGWKASINGRASPTYATDLAFRGVVVEPGRSIVEFRYRPRTFFFGAALAGLSALAIITFAVFSWLGWPPRRIRRRSLGTLSH